MITSAQIRGARAMLGLTAEALAAESKQPLASIEALETDVSSADAKALAAVRATLEARGILFIASGNSEAGGAGIRFKHWEEDGGIRPENLNATNDD
ncbi:MAG: DNA-binding protein [Rhizobiaceae bacterium]|nr:DNA-binding protein [Rhizobiaceae bacterium]